MIDLIQDIQALYKIIIVSLLGIYSLLTIIGRLNYSFGSALFSNSDWNSVGHLLKYTVIPTIIFIIAFIITIIKWDPEAPLITITSMSDIYQPLMISGGFVLILLSWYLRERVFNEQDLTSFYNWIPFIICLIGILQIILCAFL